MTPTTKATRFYDLLDHELSHVEGWPQLRCRLDPDNLATAAAILAEGIAHRRISVNPRLHGLWQSRRLEPTDDPISPRDLQVFKAGSCRT